MDIIAGRRSVVESLRGGRKIEKILLARSLRHSAIVREIEVLAEGRGIEVRKVARDSLDALAGGVPHQGVVAVAEPFRYLDLSSALSAFAEREEGRILALDGVTDPRNVGALVRTAEAAAISAVMLPKRRSAGISAAVYKSSAGAVERAKVVRVANLASAIEEAKKCGFWAYGADAKGDLSLFEAEFREKSLIVLGGEGTGLSRIVKGKCDYLIRIPMAGEISSLNVSVAGALLMYEAFRQSKAYRESLKSEARLR